MIVHVVYKLNLGGAESLLLSLAEAQVTRGMNVKIIVLNDRRKFEAEYIINNGFLGSLLEIIKSAYLAKTKTTFHTWLYISDFLVSFLTIFSNSRVIWHVHNTDLNGNVSLATRCCFFLNVIYSRLNCNTIIYASHSAQKEHQKYYSIKKGTVIPNGCRVPRTTLRQNTSLTFGSIGRLNEYKDYNTLFRALGYYCNEQITDNFLCFGVNFEDFNDGIAYERAQSRLKIQSFAGKVDRNEIYSKIDIVVIHSKSEALPLVLIESLLARKIVISTRVGDIDRYLPQELLVPSQNPCALGKKINEVYENQDVFAKLLVPFFDKAVSEFDFNQFLKKIVACYE